MNQNPVASVQNDSITPFSWDIDVVDQGTSLKLSVWDLSRPGSPKIVADGEVAVDSGELLDTNDDAPDDLARSLLDAPIAKLPNFLPNDDQRDALLEKVTDWIISTREAVADDNHGF